MSARQHYSKLVWQDWIWPNLEDISQCKIAVNPPRIMALVWLSVMIRTMPERLSQPGGKKNLLDRMNHFHLLYFKNGKPWIFALKLSTADTCSIYSSRNHSSQCSADVKAPSKVHNTFSFKLVDNTVILVIPARQILDWNENFNEG